MKYYLFFYQVKKLILFLKLDLKQPFITKTFPKAIRFFVINSNLKLCSSEVKSTAENKLAKFQDCINLFNQNAKKYYSPSQEIVVDEGMCPYKGKLKKFQSVNI